MIVGVDEYNRPVNCSKCDGLMVFMGVGEYRCEECGNVEYDDYGKVRLYLESHRGATAAKIEEDSGVSQKNIRQMLKESRLEITSESNVFLKCEFCSKQIRSGRFCRECEMNYHRQIEEDQRKNRNNKIEKVFGMDKGPADEGEKRFRRQK